MASTDIPDQEAKPKKSKMGLILGLVLALVGAGGGFYAVSSGLVLGTHDETEEAAAKPAPLDAVAFVPLDPLVVSLGAGGNSRYLRFTAQIEVVPGQEASVEAVKPRIVDVLNGYLRAIETSDLEDPAALMRLRAQMLKRIQIVTGEGRVRDLLIMEFVLD